MKHTFDETTMQAAIDAACEALGKGDFRPTAGLLDTVPGCSDWSQETHARLHLLKSALDFLPEAPPPESKTCSVCNWTNVSLLNLGEPGDPRWVCPGCCKRAFDQTQPPVVGGKTPGVLLYENFEPEGRIPWGDLASWYKAELEEAASAVLAAFGNKPAEIPWTEWRGGECPLKDEDVEEIEVKFRNTNIAASKTIQPSALRWQHVALPADIIAYRVTKWREGFGPVDWKAKCEQLEAKNKNQAADLEDISHRLGVYDDNTTTTKVAASFKCSEIHRLNAALQKAEAELANAKEIITTMHSVKLSTLRPISEAGPVTDGCVRVRAWLDTSGGKSRWIYGWSEWEGDTHFADIHLPESKIEAPTTEEFIHPGSFDPVAVTKPIHSTFTAHGKEWTPAVGNVVTLKSGSPKMTVTVLSVRKDNAGVSWFNDGVVNSASFNVSTLIPA